MKNYFVYIISNINKRLYIGITSNLEKRIYEHKNGIFEGFSKKYKCHKLVYYEEFNDAIQAIECEKKLKNWKRQWKVDLIEKNNPNWLDLSVGEN